MTPEGLLVMPNFCFFEKYLFIYFWLHWVLVAARRIFCCGAQASLQRGAQASERVGSVTALHGLSSCGAWAQ